jgi:catechol 2,3-dioxygenase
MFDPDGNLHEFYADVVEDWRTVFNPDREDLITSQWEPTAAPPSERSYWARNPEIRVVRGAVFNPKRMARAVFVAKDFKRLKEFFVDVAGLEPAQTAEDHVLLRGAAAQAGAWDVALFAPGDGLTPGLHHTVFEMTDEAALAAAERRASAGGADIELILDRPDKRSVFVRDPDGMRFEFRCARSGRAALPSDVPAALRIYFV